MVRAAAEGPPGRPTERGVGPPQSYTGTNVLPMKPLKKISINGVGFIHNVNTKYSVIPITIELPVFIGASAAFIKVALPMFLYK